MFDSTRSFAAQFTPIDGGFLYYTSRKSGGRLITADEYQELLKLWRRRSNPWGLAIATLVIIVGWAVASDAFALPEWSEGLFIAVVVAALCSWIFWAACAPRRLVRDRPAIAPARPFSEARRKARGALDWTLVSFVLLFSGAILMTKVIAPEYTFRWWAWTVGSSLALSAYLWIAVLKFRDRSRQ